MENQQLDPLVAMVDTNKKKRKRVLKIVLGIIGSLFLVAAVAGFIFYQNGRIEGKWKSPNLATEIIQDILQEPENSSEEPYIKPEEFVGETGMTLEVKDDNTAVFVLYSTINKQSLLTAFDKINEDVYNEILANIAQQAAEYGVDKETLLKETFGEDYETKIKADFPKAETLEKQFDDMIARELVKNSKARYDVATGRFSAVYFEGKVNPLTHSIQVTTVNPAPDFASMPLSVKEGDIMLYTHKGDTVTFIGGEKYPFKATN